jgi:hypothetical protein
VFCATYVVDRGTFLGEREDSGSRMPTQFSRMPVIARHKLWAPSIRQHHGMLVRSILQTPLHYNLDFPTICLKVPTFRAGDGPAIVELLLRTQAFEQILDVSSPLSTSYGIPRYSGILRSQSWPAFSAKEINFRPYTKLRLTLIPSAGELRLTPVVQLTMGASVKHETVRFTSERIQELWQQLLPPTDETDPFYGPALFRLLTTFAGMIIGAEICGRVATSLDDHFPVSKIWFDADDVKLVLGYENARAMQDIWEKIRRVPINEISEASQIVGVQVKEQPNAPDLRKVMLQLMARSPQLRPCAEELLCESVGKLFLTMREATDSPECRQENPNASRLDKGITFESINALLLAGGRGLAVPSEVSLAVDMCVDRGLAVPKIISENGSWFRAFYCGEGEDDNDPLQFKNGFFVGYGEFLKKKNAQRLSPFAVQKLCVALKDLMPWLPISTAPYKFGFTATVGHEEVVEWLTKGTTAPCRLEIDGTRQVLVPNLDYLSPVKPVWGEPSKERDFYDAFDYTATAFTRMSADAILLLTTCRTHRHTFNAVAVEAHTWASVYGKYCFETLLLAAQQVLHNRKGASSEIQQNLYWCIQYISEAFRKHRIFYGGYSGLARIVKRAFCAQGPAGQRWWTFIEQNGVLDPSRDNEIDARFAFLLLLLAQMRDLTIFVGHVLNETGVVSYAAMKAVFNAHGVDPDGKEFSWRNVSRTLRHRLRGI